MHVRDLPSRIRRIKRNEALKAPLSTRAPSHPRAKRIHLSKTARSTSQAFDTSRYNLLPRPSEICLWRSDMTCDEPLLFSMFPVRTQIHLQSDEGVDGRSALES
jgi:hypothetical protein